MNARRKRPTSSALGPLPDHITPSQAASRAGAMERQRKSPHAAG
ncbi:hypothetical protein J2W25_001983 [Variovorax boronicumulans]|uniref:Uncharacterized protein n=1 Tax=Variovorax boronicumulans TaxID=436515 RepID=A0AAW8DUH5_9BURK|nr:hypothetical protein [Variovorax boronicumulans]MDP9922962.1 hypothetical protein [Variovorax boronicumulans]